MNGHNLVIYGLEESVVSDLGDLGRGRTRSSLMVSEDSLSARMNATNGALAPLSFKEWPRTMAPKIIVSVELISGRHA